MIVMLSNIIAWLNITVWYAETKSIVRPQNRSVPLFFRIAGSSPLWLYPVTSGIKSTTVERVNGYIDKMFGCMFYENKRFHHSLDYRTPDEMHRSFVQENPLPLAA